MELQVDKLIRELKLSDEELEKFKDLIEESRKREIETKASLENSKIMLKEYEAILERFSRLLIDKTMHDYSNYAEEKA